jgi:hypothetical protein
MRAKNAKSQCEYDWKYHFASFAWASLAFFAFKSLKSNAF